MVALLPVAAGAERTLAGPIAARVTEVLDGDSVRVMAEIWPDQFVATIVRVRGIDTAELRRPRCPAERDLAERARAAVAQLIADRPVRLYQVETGKFGGRVLARLETEDGVDLASHLLERGLARDYQGGRRQSWCPESD